MARMLERLGRYDEALTWYQRLDQRYERSREAEQRPNSALRTFISRYWLVSALASASRWAAFMTRTSLHELWRTIGSVTGRQGILIGSGPGSKKAT